MLQTHRSQYAHLIAIIEGEIASGIRRFNLRGNGLDTRNAGGKESVVRNKPIGFEAKIIRFVRDSRQIQSQLVIKRGLDGPLIAGFVDF